MRTCHIRPTSNLARGAEAGMRTPSLSWQRARRVAPTRLAALLALVLLGTSARTPAPAERHFLYVASPGTRNYTEYGGVGLLVFDIDDGYRFVRRIPTWKTAEGAKPENV